MDFVDGMNKFAIGDQVAWCRACGNSTGVCGTATTSGTSPTATGTAGNGKSGGGGGISRAVAGVIGAMVTLAVVLGLEALVLLLGGFRFVRKRGAANGGVVGGNGVESK